MLIIALIINLIIIFCEAYVLLKVKVKKHIFKYYTFLQNFLTAIVSIIFIIYIIANMLFNYQIPEYVKGLRYITTCGLITTTLIYVLFLTTNDKNKLSNEDFNHLNPKLANILLHYFCPILSLVSFIFFEQEIILKNSIWTSIAALPSLLYWLIYLILSFTKSWEEPYDLTSKKNGVKGLILDILTFLLIPILFILVSFVLWQIK